MKSKQTLCALAIGLALQSSYTAAADSVVLEKITVTSQKREQYINDVSIAVTAFSGEQMESLGFESSTDLIAFTPGVSLAGDIGGQRAIFNIRGVVQNDYADIAEAPVAVYVDGGYLASTQAQTFGLFDIARVEILKGPQGTLFGRNATGGMVNTITAKPTEEMEGYAELTFASFEQKRFEGAVSGALSDKVSGRISVMANHMGNILENVYEDEAAPDTRAGTIGGGEDGYNDDTKAFRAQLNFDLNANSNLLVSANWADTTKSEGPYQVVNTTEVKDAAGNVIDVIYAADDPLGCDTIQAGACVDGNFNGDPLRPVQGGDFNGNIDPDGSGEKVNKDFAFEDQNKIKSRGLAATYDYDFDDFTFTSVTDWKNFTRVIGLDSDQTASPELIFQSDGDITQFSEELRISGNTTNSKWVAGFYYLSIETDYLQGLAASPTGGYLAGEEQNTLATIDTDSYSVFGQIDYDLTEELVLVSGLRLVRENKSMDGQLRQNANLVDRDIEVDYSLEPLVDVAMDNDETMWSAKLQLDYKPNSDTLLYAGINRGVKAGNFNAPLGGSFSTYDAEVLLAYEAGAKLTLMDGKAQLNSSIFYYDYSDYQSFSWVNNAGVVFNEDAQFTGAEVELLLNPIDALDIMFGVSYTDAVVEDLEVASGVFVDTTPPYTPEWQSSGLVRYTWDIDSGSVAALISGSYQSESFHNARNFTAHTIESHFKADARITWTDKEDLWSVAAYVDNLTDSDHELIGFDVSGFYGTSQISYAKPRTYGVTVRRNF
ncbi:TonB-dependent receptor [Alteromonas sp. 1_MG-2023]|uniref:TonB-dependent receptor n=1 Tax=Alteromonas sp. 1_MG-2023 TaxID=3062669 RepID=UPI0026E23684|nr:TonB-dependent receptor [Alteromonas sp. 1_MG-2023]